MTDPGVAADALVVADPSRATHRTKREKRKLYGKTAKVGALWAMGRESVTQLLGIPTAFLLARLLSPADFGVAAAATLFIQLGKRMGNMGLNTALVRMKEVREEHRAAVFCINMVFGLLAWATIMLAAPSIARFYGDARVAGAVRLSSTIFLVNFFGAVEYAVLQRDMKFKEMAFIEWITPIVFMPLSIGMAWAGWGYWSLLVAQLVANAASTGGKVYYGRWRPSLAATRRGFAETVPFGMGVYAKRLLSYAAENLDSFIVGGMFGVTPLGFYDKAFNTAGNLSNRLSLGSAVVLRIFAVIQDERERLLRAYTKVVLSGTLVTLPVFAGLIVAAREFVVVAFGRQWLPAILPFQLLCAAGALRLMTAYASAAVQANGQIWGEVWRKVAHVVLIVGLIVALRPWGIAGAALAVFLATLILAVLMQGLVGRIIGVTWREMMVPLVPSAVAAAGTALVVGAITLAGRRVAPALPEWALLGLQAAGGGLFWLAFTLFVRFRALQDVVDEMLDDLVPRAIARHIDRLRRRPNRIAGT